ncbi:MAG TPA: S9 family peptidase, partial [Rhodanobacter sp.]
MPKSSHLLVSLALLAAPWALQAADTAPRMGSHIEQLQKRLDQVKRIGAVAVSPDGTRLAWVREGKQPAIELADADGHGAHALDVGKALAGCDKRDIAWSPDSRRLAFIANCGKDLTNTEAMHNDVYLADVAGTAAPHELAKLAGYARALVWTADGKQLGFLYVPGATRHASATAAGKPQVGVIGEDEHEEVQRVASLDAGNGALHVLTPAALYAYEFDFSPDGSRIAYTAAPPPGDNNWWVAKLYVQDARAGAAPRAIVDPST